MNGYTLAIPAETLEALALHAAEIVTKRLPSLKPVAASPYLTTAEAATFLRCSRQRIYDLLSAGRLSRHKEGTRTLVLRQQLEQLVEVDGTRVA